MSNETKPLTAEEMLRPFVREHNTDSHWSSWDYVSPEDAAKCMEDFAAQQTAALREELEELKQRIYAPPMTRGQIERRADELGNTYRMKLEEGQAARRGYLLGYQDAIEQVEAVKKERCEALKLLNHIQSTPQYFMQVHIRERIRRFLERTDDACWSQLS